MEECTIFLSNGNELNARQSMTEWYSDTEITEDIFEDGLDDVSYVTPDGNEVRLGECGLIYHGYSEESGWSFCLYQLSTEEKNNKLIRQAISDVSDAILEMSEIVYGEG